MKKANEKLVLEPAERDPKAIRNTVLVLVALMLVGGFLIVNRYLDKMGGEAEETQKGRPALALGSVTRENYQFENPEGEVKDMRVLEGKVTLLTTVSLESAERSKQVLKVLVRAAEKFKEKEDFQIVVIGTDAYEKDSISKLKSFCNSVGAGDTGSWIFLVSKGENLNGYLKDRLKLGLVNHNDKDGNAVYADVTRLIDPALRIRGKADHFYFSLYTRMKEAADAKLAVGAENDGEKKKLTLDSAALAGWEEYLHLNVGYILNEEQYDGAAISAQNEKNRYEKPLYIFGAFVLFVVVIGYRLKKARKKNN